MEEVFIMNNVDVTCSVPVYDSPDCDNEYSSEHNTDKITIKNTNHNGIIMMFIDNQVIFVNGNQLIGAISRCL